MVHQTFEGCQPKQNPRVSLDILTDLVQFSSRVIRLAINILYIYRFLTAINSIRLRDHSQQDEQQKIRPPYMCATRHHLSVEPDVVELHKELRKLMYRFKHDVKFIAHTIQHYPHLLFQTVPLLESSLNKLQCNLDDLELAATFDGQTRIASSTGCHSPSRKKNRNQNQQQVKCTDDKIRVQNNNHQTSSTRNQLPTFQTDSEVSSSLTSDRSAHHSSRPRSGYLHRLEMDEEQVYIIARNTHLALHTLLINAKLIHLTTKDGIRAGVSTVLFPFIYDIGKKFCLAFHYLQLLSKYVSYRAVQTEHRPVPPLTDFRVNLYPANRQVITEANQVLVDNFARTVKRNNVRFKVSTQQCLPPSILTRRFSRIKRR